MNNKRTIIRLIDIINERKLFYIVSYIIGCTATILIIKDIKPWYFTFFNINSIFISILLGNCFYHGYNKMPLYKTPLQAIKYIVWFLIIAVVLRIISVVLNLIGFDLFYYIAI